MHKYIFIFPRKKYLQVKGMEIEVRSMKGNERRQSQSRANQCRADLKSLRKSIEQVRAYERPRVLAIFLSGDPHASCFCWVTSVHLVYVGWGPPMLNGITVSYFSSNSGSSTVICQLCA